MRLTRLWVVAAVGLLTAWLLFAPRTRARASDSATPPGPATTSTATVTRREFVRTIRLHGVVEPVHSYSVTVPRLAGQPVNTLVVVRLAAPGSIVAPGDLLVEFDRQNQLKTAFDRRADFLDLLEQIKKKQAEQASALAKDETELKTAEHAVTAAELDMLKNDMLSRVDAEKNRQNLEEARAKRAQLRTTFAAKRDAARAELGILEIQRDRARNAMRHAEANAGRMKIVAPIGGMIVARSIWKSGQMGEVQEGEEVRPGVPVLQVVDPSRMQVRARVNQADAASLAVGQRASIQLDAYPETSFAARLDTLSPIATASALSSKVRTFVAVFSIAGSGPTLLPDLSAAIDVEVERLDNVLVVPRDAVFAEAELFPGADALTKADLKVGATGDGVGATGARWFVRIASGSSRETRAVKIGSRGDLEVVVLSGIEPGTVVARGDAARGAR